MRTKEIYVLFSATPYKMGKMIRFFGKTQYNHVSIMLDSDFREMYSFARRNFYHPLYGGFVRECTDRYQLGNDIADVKVCKIVTKEETYCKIKKQLDYMKENESDYLYNFLAIFGIPFRKRIKVRDAYTCVEFVTDILYKVGVDISCDDYFDICDLEHILEENIVYQGPIVLRTNDELFFARLSLPYFKIFKDFLYLFARKEF